MPSTTVQRMNIEVVVRDPALADNSPVEQRQCHTVLGLKIILYIIQTLHASVMNTCIYIYRTYCQLV